jgi:ribosome-associated protein
VPGPDPVPGAAPAAVPPADPGDLPVGGRLVLPAAELRWHFSRSSGPGGQSVNTTDSRVELRWNPEDSAALAGLGPDLRSQVLERLRPTLVRGNVVVVASEQRSQLRNRDAARQRLAVLLRAALAAPHRPRRPTRPTRGSVERRLRTKAERSRRKADRRGRRGED